MPWSESDVERFNKKAASNPATRKQWVEVANKTLSETGDDARAVRTANAAVSKRKRFREKWNSK